MDWMHRIISCVALLLVATTFASAAPSNLAVSVEPTISPTPVKANGAFHAVYELRISNYSRHQLHLHEIAVTGASGQRVLAQYDGQSLIDALSRPGAPADITDKRALAAGMSAVVFIDVATKARDLIPAILFHRITFDPVAGLPLSDVNIPGVRVTVRSESPITLGPPLRGGGWVASHAFSNASEHRRSIVFVGGKPWLAQRFAIDWLRIGSNGQAFHDEPANNAYWAPYGAEVLAVADGQVAKLMDGVPENNPTSETKAVPINIDTASGNYIILDLSAGRYALYAHLKPGSFQVQLGEQVKRGQVIALLGNSGNADAPHLHFQVMDASSALAAEGLPYVFHRFAVEGTLPSLGVLSNGRGWRPEVGPVDVRQDELPTENEVIDFDVK
jgi:murein DD-endopeptidase